MASRSWHHTSGIASRSRRSIEAPKRERCARHAAISLALSRRRIAGLPSPHHAAGTLASKELAPHQAMHLRKESSVQHVLETGEAARIGVIECQRSRSPAQPDHRAPFRGDGLLFGYQHQVSHQTLWRHLNESGSMPRRALKIARIRRALTIRNPRFRHIVWEPLKPASVLF